MPEGGRVAEAPKVPAGAAMTGAFRILRTAERFGMDPDRLDRMEPGRLALYLAFNDMREAIEAGQRSIR